MALAFSMQAEISTTRKTSKTFFDHGCGFSLGFFSGFLFSYYVCSRKTNQALLSVLRF